MVEDEDVQLRVLEALEGARNYNAWLADLTLPHLAGDPVEIGSGLGANAVLWLERGIDRLTVSEPDTRGIPHLRDRFAGDTRVTVEQIDLTAAPERAHSACIALNVLEHIEDDVGALRGAQRLVRPGGAVVMFVPAFGFAAGRFDRMIGHHRRYTRATLTRAYVEAGLRPASVRYVNAPGLLAWFVMMRLLRQVPREGAALRFWDGRVIPGVRRIERRWSPPFGQSVIAVGYAEE